MADDELFVDQNDVEGTASGVWSRMLAGNRHSRTSRNIRTAAPRHMRRSSTRITGRGRAMLLRRTGVSPDIIFDAGIGDLFHVRTAGQVIDNAVIASLDYAVDVLGVRLLVVLGHQNCGAIKQACKEYDALLHNLTASAEDSLMAADSVADLDERIMNADSIMLRTVGFSIWQAHESELESDEDFERVPRCTAPSNSWSSTPESIQQALASDRLMIVGAGYPLDSGKVEVLTSEMTFDMPLL